jgi:uncharacterized protein YkwD
MTSVESSTTPSRRLPVRARVALPLVVAIFALAVGACAPAGSSGSGYTGDSVSAANQDRAAAGLAPLAWDHQLELMAGSWASHLAQTGALEHNDLGAVMRLPYMSQWWTLGENLLAGPAMSAEGAEGLWMNSPGHRANILNPNFRYIGAAAVQDSSGGWWYVAEFGAR